MKLKTLAVVAFALATSSAFATPAPALGDDTNNNAMMSGSPNATNNVGGANELMAANNNPANDMVAANNNNPHANGFTTESASDDMSADTATGDDDY